MAPRQQTPRHHTPELGQLTHLQLLALGNNQLRGPFPLELTNLRELQYLYVVAGNCPGRGMGELHGLECWCHSLAPNNMLEGTLPTDLGNMTGLQNL